MNKEEQLNLIKNKILNELKCPIKDTANNLVFGKGNPNAEILFIGEAPGEKEDLEGKPFVGKAGKQLDKLLNKIDLTLDEVYIANILKYRPPKNRDPKKEEIIAHTPYLIEQIKIIKPKIIATLGNYSTKFILANFDIKKMKKIQGISELHGKPQKLLIDGFETLVIPIYHPAAQMYNPKVREHFENDFREMAKILNRRFIKEDIQKSLI